MGKNLTMITLLTKLTRKLETEFFDYTLFSMQETQFYCP
ncbi:hypothetical protein DFH65_001837 [Clostridium beijerinckii]|nr:hypothetical protein [Clostridium beijerinckii]NRW01147.1 hypothetical protein [Clostridium beijerinckii]NRW20217.1 hypothetical protein [Clostridium beijerinckii]NRX67979.1 hypothetical protein [Clostridium beijerinckii]NRY74935.1 hypothetical protein [Clostridium beijerinckii]